MNYYQRHIGDYTTKTVHLSILEHGVYNLLLDRYYTREAPIPDSQKYRLLCARTPEEMAAVDAVLNEFFQLDGDVWRQARCDAEIAERHEFVAKQAERGRMGGKQKKANAYPNDGVADATPDSSKRLASARPELSERLASATPEASERLANAKPPVPRSPFPVPQSKNARDPLEPIRAAYPKGGREDWTSAAHHAHRIVGDGEAAWPDLLSAVERYAALCRATGRTVMNPGNFFGAADKPWSQSWSLPEKPNGLDPAAEQAWQDAIADRNRTPRLQRALDSVGGIMRIKTRTPNEEPKLRAEFMRAWSAS